MTLWRISSFADLTGEGGLRASGRWHTRGRRVVYLADHPAACLLEMLVQVAGLEALPPAYQWLAVDTGDASVDDVASLPLAWARDVVLTRMRGDDWLAQALSPLLRVPSVLTPASWNYLLNPAHPASYTCHIAEAIAYPFDDRLRV